MSKGNRAWREFEKVVSQIERTLAPLGAEVKSPDRVPDQDGTIREVDATIRMKVGSATVLITVECRKRRARQDKTWIEQIAKKRESLNAAKTIAVSSSPFSKSARLAARRFGIDVREVRELTEGEILSWCSIRDITVISERADLKSVGLVLSQSDLDELGWNGRTQFSGNDELFSTSSCSKNFSALTLLRHVQNEHGIGKLLSEPGRCRVHLKLAPTNGELLFHHAEKTVRVCELILEVELSRMDGVHQMSRAVQYGDPDGQAIHAIEFPCPANGMDAALMLARDMSTGEVSMSIRVDKIPNL